MTVRLKRAISLILILGFWAWAIILSTSYPETIINLGSDFNTFFTSAAGYGLIMLIIISALLYWQKENFKTLGLNKKRISTHIGIGALFGIGMFIQSTWIVSPVVTATLPPGSNPGIDLTVLFNNVNQLPLWLALAIFKGGFQEELWRIFGLTKFEQAFGKRGLIAAILMGSFVFGLQHSYQGMDSVIGTGIDGILYALIYLRKRSAIEAITAHAVFDIIGISLFYIFF